MQKFCTLIKGTHDFSGFKASGGQTENDVRTIYSAKLIKKGNDLTFVVTGNGFLYKMVRNLVGTMLKIGEGKLSLTELKTTIFKTFKSTNNCHKNKKIKTIKNLKSKTINFSNLNFFKNLICSSLNIFINILPY